MATMNQVSAISPRIEIDGKWFKVEQESNNAPVKKNDSKTSALVAGVAFAGNRFPESIPKVPSEPVSVFLNGKLVENPVFDQRRGRGGRGRGGGGKSTKPIHKRLVYNPANVVGAAGAALVSTVNMQPSLFSDWAAEIQLYDEVKVVSGEVFWYVVQTPGAAAANRVFVAQCYDPIDGTALTSVQSAIQYSQHCGPVQLSGTNAGGLYAAAFPSQVTKTGANHWKFNTLKQTARNATGVTVMSGGDWSSTVDAADIYGFIKTYVPAPGGTVVNELCQLFVLNCLFRSDV